MKREPGVSHQASAANATDQGTALGIEHHGGQLQNLAFRAKPFEDRPKKKAPAAVFRQSTHRLPYFAHQQLDPEYFPRSEFPLHDSEGLPCFLF